MTCLFEPGEQAIVFLPLLHGSNLYQKEQTKSHNSKQRPFIECFNFMFGDFRCPNILPLLQRKSAWTHGKNIGRAFGHGPAFVCICCLFHFGQKFLVFGALFVQIFLSADAAHYFFLVSGCCVILLVRKHIPLESWPIFRPIFLNNILTNISTRISFRLAGLL